MPRVKTVAKARKSPGECPKCGKKIKKGTSYRWWKFRFGGKRIRCTECPGPRQSELTNSDKLSRCYAAGESIQDAIDDFQKDEDVENLRATMESAAEEIREVAQEYRDSAQNVEDGMNGNRMPICDELEEKADNLEGKADEIEQAAADLEEFNEEEAEEEAKEEAKEGGKDGPTAEEILKDKKETWAEEQVSKAEEHTDISPEG